MSNRERRHHSAERKAALLRRHLVEKVPVSQVCEEGQVKPSVFYRWQRDLFEGAATVLSTRRAPSRERELEEKVARLEAKLSKKDAIIAEISEEYVALKKELGEP